MKVLFDGKMERIAVLEIHWHYIGSAKDQATTRRVPAIQNLRHILNGQKRLRLPVETLEPAEPAAQ